MRFTATQAIFNRDVLLAARSAGINAPAGKTNTASTKIDVTVSVSQSLYDVLATTQQIKYRKTSLAWKEASGMPTINTRPALPMETRLQRAQIALNNTKALLRSNEEALKASWDISKH